MDTYLTVEEVALLVKLAVSTIRRYTMNKEIPFHKIGRAVRYKKTEIEAWVEKREKEAQDQNADLFEETETAQTGETTETGGEV